MTCRACAIMTGRNWSCTGVHPASWPLCFQDGTAESRTHTLVVTEGLP